MAASPMHSEAIETKSGKITNIYRAVHNNQRPAKIQRRISDLRKKRKNLLDEGEETGSHGVDVAGELRVPRPVHHHVHVPPPLESLFLRVQQ